MRHTTAMIFCLCALLAACGSQSREAVQPQAGVISEGEYLYAPIGWRMSIPWRWDVLSQQEVQATVGKGRAMLEEAAGEELVDLETQLLYLSYGARNGFTSSVSHFDVSLGSEQEQVAETIRLILEAYKASNMRPRLATHESETIDGIRFDLVHISIMDPRGRREKFRQHFYLGRVGSSWITVSITAIDWIPRQQMLHAWRGSRFSPPSETD